jgi:SDR family mycofactocin-dependent oxidoreductase
VSRVAVVTGAARGIGAATVLQLASRGWQVVAVDRCSDDPRLPYAMGTRSELDAVAEICTAQGMPGSVLTIAGDTCSEADVRLALRTAEETFGGVDAVLAVAGVIAGGVPLWEQPEDELDAVLDVNLRGVVTLARVGVPALLRRPSPRSGRFIAVSSAAATRGLPLLAAYCAAKAGVLGLVRGIATELRGTGVTANAVSPGSTDTPILLESARLYRLESAEAFAGQQSIERLLAPGEIAATLAWLAGPESSAITGAAVAADGGLAL